LKLKVETKNAQFLSIFFHWKLMLIKPSHASSSNHSQETDDNEEIELRRSKRVRKETNFGKNFFTFLVGDYPFTYKEAISSSDALLWKEPINNELESILSNHTWELVVCHQVQNQLVANGYLKENWNLMGL